MAETAAPDAYLGGWQLWADGNYDGPLVPWLKTCWGFALEIVVKPDGQTGFSVLCPTALARRWVVERTFAWLGKQRRLSKDYEEMPPSSEAFIQIAMSALMVRRLAPA